LPKGCEPLYQYVDRRILEECETQHTLQHIHAQVVRREQVDERGVQRVRRRFKRRARFPQVQCESFVLREALPCPRHGLV
jgi:hypothetical protein